MTGPTGSARASRHVINTPLGQAGDGNDDTPKSFSSLFILDCDYYFQDLTVDGTIYNNGYRIFVRGTLTLNGTISNNGSIGGNGGDGTTANPGAFGIGGISLNGTLLLQLIQGLVELVD